MQSQWLGATPLSQRLALHCLFSAAFRLFLFYLEVLSMKRKSNRGKVWNPRGTSGQVRCHCGRPAVLRSAEGICKTHRPDAKVYVCSGYPACDSFVMAHPGTLEPMGTLAPPELRRLRYEAHQQFDQLHKSGLMTRREA